MNIRTTISRLWRAIAWLVPLAQGCNPGPRVDGPDTEPLSLAFCEDALPAVAQFMESARADRPVPDDARYGGTVVVGGPGELPGGMNAAVSIDPAGTQHQQFVNLMTLIDYDERFEPRPYLAESWTMSEDGRSITFRLRRDVYWHDGERTDAYDVAFTWDVVTDPVTGFPNPSYWTHFVTGPGSAEVLDEFTVRIRLEPHADFLDPFRTLAILPEHLLREVPHEQLRAHPYGTQCPVGNGPFVFESHTPGREWVFAANPAFPGDLGGRPFVDRYVYRTIPDGTELLTDLRIGRIDVFLRPQLDQLEAILGEPDLEVRRFPFRDFVFVAWNTRRPQLADARVRRAITMATNREEYVSLALAGYARVQHTTLPAFHWAYGAESLPILTYDPAAARALLDDAGWLDRDGDGVRETADGRRLSISIKYNAGNQLRQQLAESMEAQLAEVGIAARSEMLEWTTLLDDVMAERDFDGVVMGWVADFSVDDSNLFHSEWVDQPYALAGLRSTRLDRLLEALSTAVDRREARDLWHDYQVELIEEQPYTFYYSPDRLVALNRRVRGVVMDARGEWVNIRDWYLSP